MNDLSLGWELMGYGLLGVFTTLIAFMLVIHLIRKLFPENADSSDQD